MDIAVPVGKYVVAVSGGVDSVALLHMVAREQIADQHTFVVAHYDHGIRPDSAEDMRLVRQLAQGYGLQFVHESGNLGPKASEATARQARYAFLHRVRTETGARAIITAHHQDDVLETMLLNLFRGTGRRGLSSLKNTDVVQRPLLHVPKNELLRYAEREGLQWREDSTNSDEHYLRNYVRLRILPRFAAADREALLAIGRRAHELNEQISVQTVNYLHAQPARTALDRHEFIMLPHVIAREIMAEWLLANTGVELSRRLLERLVVAAKTGRIGSKFDVDAGHWLEVSQTTLALIPRER